MNNKYRQKFYSLKQTNNKQKTKHRNPKRGYFRRYCLYIQKIQVQIIKSLILHKPLFSKLYSINNCKQNCRCIPTSETPSHQCSLLQAVVNPEPVGTLPIRSLTVQSPAQVLVPALFWGWLVGSKRSPCWSPALLQLGLCSPESKAFPVPLLLTAPRHSFNFSLHTHHNNHTLTGCSKSLYSALKQSLSKH